MCKGGVLWWLVPSTSPGCDLSPLLCRGGWDKEGSFGYMHVVKKSLGLSWSRLHHRSEALVSHAWWQKVSRKRQVYHTTCRTPVMLQNTLPWAAREVTMSIPPTSDPKEHLIYLTSHAEVAPHTGTSVLHWLNCIWHGFCLELLLCFLFLSLS